MLFLLSDSRYGVSLLLQGKTLRLNDMISENLALAGARIVGAVFVIAAVMKVAAPASFFRHVSRLGLLPGSLVRPFVPLAIGLEAGWGVALMLAVLPHVVLPFTALALVVLSCLSLWGVRSGKTEDCGCYGGFITPSIWQSVGMNALYVLLIAAAWLNLYPVEQEQVWKLGAVVLAIVIVGGTAEFALRAEFSTGIPFFTPSPLTVGRRWKAKWAGSAKAGVGTDQLVSYLGPNCPYCKQWVRVLNVIHASPAFPAVTAVLASSEEAIDAFSKETGVRFPISTVSEPLMQRLASAVPTTILIERGLISEVWTGQMSPQFVERVKQVFFPSAAGTAGTSSDTVRGTGSNG